MRFVYIEHQKFVLEKLSFDLDFGLNSWRYNQHSALFCMISLHYVGEDMPIVYSIL